MNQQIERIINDFQKYLNSWNIRREEIPYELKTSIIRQIVRTGSIDTTRFIQAVDFREGGFDADGYRYLIDSARNSEVYYDGFVEFDTRNYPGRYNFRDGIENANIRRITDNFADDSFRG